MGLLRASPGRAGRFGHLVVEGAVIVASVVLALAAEDWRAERNERADVKDALLSLDREAGANLEEIESFLEVARARYERLVQVQTEVDGSRPFAEHVSDFGGFRVPDLELSSWARVASDPRVRGFAPERLAEAFAVYRSLDLLSGLDQRIVEFVFSADYHDAARAEVSYRIAETILAQQIRWAEDAVSRLRGFLDRTAEGAS